MRRNLEKMAVTGGLMVLALMALLALTGCGAGNGEDSGDEGTPPGTYEIGFHCTVDPEDAEVLMEQLNDYRRKQGGEPLKWNSDPENEMLTRAAELAISYSDTRLNGEPGVEMRRGCFESPGDWAEELLADEDFCKGLCDPEMTSLCIGIIQSWYGGSFGALDLYPAAGEAGAAVTDGPAWKKNDEKTFRLKATDEYLNCRGQLMDGDMEPVRADDLFAGESYYYAVINNDPNNGDYEEELETGYSSSEDPEIAAIDENGWVTAKKSGTTTIEVRPAKESGIRLQLKVTVK